MLLSAYAKFDLPEFTDIVKRILVFVTRWSILLGFDSSGLETLLFELGRDLRRSRTPLRRSLPATNR
jgi:hypothetical protein